MRGCHLIARGCGIPVVGVGFQWRLPLCRKFELAMQWEPTKFVAIHRECEELLWLVRGALLLRLGLLHWWSRNCTQILGRNASRAGDAATPIGKSGV